MIKMSQLLGPQQPGINKSQLGPQAPFQMQERLNQNQYKIQQSTIDEINKFVADHTLSKQDAYAWITGKYGPRVANDWSAAGSLKSTPQTKGPEPTPISNLVGNIFSPKPAATQPTPPTNPIPSASDIFNLNPKNR
jgi:hypothetical protein